MTTGLQGARPLGRPTLHLGDRTIALAIFAGVAAAYIASAIRLQLDGELAIATAVSLLDGRWGDLTGHRDAPGYTTLAHGDRILTVYPLGTPLLLVPILLVLKLTAPAYLAHLAETHSATPHKVLASLIAAAAVAVLWHALRLRFSRAASLFLCLAFAFGTSMWSTSSRSLWQHGALILAYAATLFFLLRARDDPAAVQWTGLTLACAYVSRPTAAIPIIVISTFVLLYHRRWFWRYAMWGTLVAVPWFALNLAMYGQVLTPYYLPWTFGFAPLLGEGLIGHMVSPSRGLLLFSPMLILAVPGALTGWRDGAERPLVVALAVIVIWHWLMAARFPIWWGGVSFGPRLMADIEPFLVLLMGYAVAPAFARATWLRRVAVALAAVSIVIHAQGALVGAGYGWNGSPTHVDEHPERLWDWHDPQVLAGLRRWRGLP